MTEPDQPHSKDVSASVSPRRSRIFWTTAALAIGAMLLLCAALVLIASSRS